MAKAILLLNMGGPSSINEVEMFLKNMFADPYILQTNSLIRKIVGTIIVKKRLEEAKENYRSIGGKSPLLEITDSLAQKVERISSCKTYPVMRYVPPFAKDILLELKKQNIDEIVLFSMYPHYSTTTTKSSIEDIMDCAKEINYSPKFTTVERYYSNSDFIDIQCALIKEALGDKDENELKLIISAHGLPLDIINSGDPYQKEIEANVELIKKRLQELDLNFKEIELAYQSKVGNGTWLEPNLVDILRNPTNLNVLIFPIAFTIDNSETIFELDIEHKEIATKLGYNYYKVAKCPNNLDEFANLIIKYCHK